MAAPPDSLLSSKSVRLFARVVAVAVFGTLALTLALAFGAPTFSASDRFANLIALTAAVFAAVASFGVIFAILVQRRELELQRDQLALQTKELALARTEYARAADAQEASKDVLREQVASLDCCPP